MIPTQIEQFGKRLVNNVAVNAPTILSGLAISGVVLTTVLGGEARLKAHRILQVKKHEMERDQAVEWGIEGGVKIPPKDVFLLTWKAYLPTVVMGLLTVGAIVAVNTIHLKRNNALTALYGITEAAFIEYQKKVIAAIGDKKAGKIHDDIVQDQLDKNPVVDQQIIITGDGETLCFDSLSGRYFKSSMEKIKAAVNEFNMRLIHDMYRPLNELYDDLGLEPTAMGAETGWTTDTGQLVDVFYTTKLAKNGIPCLVVEFKVSPRKL